MILADDVFDQNGLLILRAGHRVSRNHLRTLKAWGITEVDVEVSNEEREIDGGNPGTILGNVSVEVKMEVDGLFRYADQQHPAVAELMEICTLRKMEAS